jgi:hypothetical protein
MIRSTYGLTALLCLATTASAVAAPTTWEFRGQLTEVGGDLAPSFAVGAGFRLRLSFDSDAPLYQTQTDGSGGFRYNHEDMTLAVELLMDGDPTVYEITAETLGQIFLRDNMLADTGIGTPTVKTDGISFALQRGPTAGDGEDMGLIFRGTDLTVFAGDVLPVSPDPRLLDMQLHTLQYCRWEDGRIDPVTGLPKPCASLFRGNFESVRRITGPQLADLTLRSNVVSGCKSVTGTVTLDAPAPVGGRIVTLSDTLESATVVAQVKIAEGALSRNFSVKTAARADDESGTIIATVDEATLEDSLTVRPMGLSSLSFPTSSTVGGGSLAGTVKLECAAGPGDIVVELNSSLPGVALPSVATVVIGAGVQSAPVVVNTAPVVTRQRPVISATANETQKTKTLTVNP